MMTAMAPSPVLVLRPRFNDTARVLSEAAVRRGLRTRMHLVKCEHAASREH